MEINFILSINFLIEIMIFLILMHIFNYAFNRMKGNPHTLLNPKEYFPEEEIHSLKQIFFLIMMGLCFINVLYSIIFFYNDIIYFVIFDIVLSLYIAVNLDKSTLLNKIMLLLLIPYGSLYYILFGNSLYGIITLIHIPVYIYFIKVYYDRFREYTVSNGLWITIVLLFIIIFVSFFLTQLFEGVNPLDSLVMVSNAFTSNGYSVLGNTVGGKIDAIILVWGGYLLSGVGTATLASAILIRHFHKKIENIENKLEDVENLIKEINKD